LLAIKNALVRLLEWIVIIVVAALVLDVLWGVFSRFVLRWPSRWTEEVATILLIWVSLLGAAVAFGRNEHLGIDYLVKKFDPSARRLMAIVVQLDRRGVRRRGAGLRRLRAGQRDAASRPGHLGAGHPAGHVYLAVPISGAFILLFCLERIVELILGRAGDDSDGQRMGFRSRRSEETHPMPSSR
jgi:TRAP-type C4-dicarboxylate transport system permease small subunit